MNATSASPSKRRPSITISYAQTLDGRLATATGQSQWISGPESLDVTHRLRARHAAIMVGSGTVLADDPSLTVRRASGKNPVRIVVDGRLQTPLDAAVVDDAAPTLIATLESAPPDRCAAYAARGVEVLPLPAADDGHLNLHTLFAVLSERGITSVMVEGGAGLITALLRERLADRVAITVAPRLLGRGIEAVGELGIRQLADAIELRRVNFEFCGRDLVILGDLHWPDDEKQTCELE